MGFTVQAFSSLSAGDSQATQSCWVGFNLAMRDLPEGLKLFGVLGSTFPSSKQGAKFAWLNGIYCAGLWLMQLSASSSPATQGHWLRPNKMLLDLPKGLQLIGALGGTLPGSK